MNSEIVRAIRERKLIKLNYDPGERLVEPHVYGESKDGNNLLRCFQVSGASASNEHKDWKLFRTDKISGLAVQADGFSGPRQGYNPDDPAMKGQIYAAL